MFSDQFWSGELYPRWLNAAENGLGVPVFVYYAPLFYYVGCLWQWLSNIDTYGFFRVLLTINLFQIFGVIGAYLWLEKHMDFQKASMAALFYIFMPYLMNLVFYYNVAIEAILCIFPWCLWAAERAITHGKPRDLALLCIMSTLLIYAHGLLAPLFFGVLSAYILFLCRSDWHKLKWLIPCGGIALGLAAPYWLVAYINMPYFDQLHVFTSGKFQWDGNFFRPIDLPKFFFMILCPVLIGFTEKMTHKYKIADRASLWFWCTVFAVGIFFNLPVSSYFWRHVDFLQHLQFAWRFYMPMLIAVTYISASLLPIVKFKQLCVIITLPALLLGVSSYYNQFSNDVSISIWTEKKVFFQESLIGMEYHTSLPHGQYYGGMLAYSIALVCFGLLILGYLLLKDKRTI